MKNNKSKEEWKEQALTAFSSLHKIRRNQLNLTQQQLAEMTGFSLSTIQAYEHGRYLPEDLDFYLATLDEMEMQLKAKKFEGKVRGKNIKRAVLQLNAETGKIITEYSTCGVAEKITGLKRQNIYRAAETGRKCGGYSWRYKKKGD